MAEQAIFVVKAAGAIVVAMLRSDGVVEIHERGPARALCRFLGEAPFDGVSLGDAQDRDGAAVELDGELRRDVEETLFRELCAPMARAGAAVGHA